jgi:hypothetical protein
MRITAVDVVDKCARIELEDVAGSSQLDATMERYAVVQTVSCVPLEPAGKLAGPASTRRGIPQEEEFQAKP